MMFLNTLHRGRIRPAGHCQALCGVNLEIVPRHGFSWKAHFQVTHASSLLAFNSRSAPPACAVPPSGSRQGLQGLISSDVFTLVKENREIDGPARGKASKSTQKATVILHQAKLVL